MPGDYTRISYRHRQRYNSVLQQQGRVQLDSDWNEAADIVRERVRKLGLDQFGPIGIGEATPNAFHITPIVGPPIDLGISPGRLYVDGLLAECFPDENATYLKQPYLPDPPTLPPGDVVVYVDLRDREVTWVQDPQMLDASLGGRDTTTRLQTVWQVKVAAVPGAACGMPVGAAPSAGRLTTSAIAPPTPDDPCLLPPVAGYRGLENRLYRLEIQNGGPMGTARYKWSRDNGSIVSAVSATAVAGGQTQLTVNRLGRDAVLGFAIGNWVTVTDDHRELAEEPGEMARIVDILPATSMIVLDRAIPAGGSRPFGATPADIAARHTRVQRWDQSATTNAVDGDGLIVTGPGTVLFEDGVQVQLSLEPGGVFNNSDWWVFWARVATASVEVLDKAPPRGNHHHYVQLAAITGLGGAGPVPSDCRPGKSGSDCCCTVVVAPGQDIQAAIDSLPGVGGCICLRAGVHVIRQPLTIARSDVKLEGESPGTTVRLAGKGPVLSIGVTAAVQRIEVCDIDFEIQRGGGGAAAIMIATARAVRMERCAARGGGATDLFGIVMRDCTNAVVSDTIIEGSPAGGIWLLGDNTQDILLAGNTMTFDQPVSGAAVPAVFGILCQEARIGIHVVGNTISGVASGIVVNDTAGTAPNSFSTQVHVRDNRIACITPTLTSGVQVVFGIDLTASQSIAEGNEIRLPQGADAHVGIRIAGWGTEAVGNAVYGRGGASPAPVGVQIGYGGAAAAIPTGNVRLLDNFITGCPVGILAQNVDQGVIGSNILSARSVTGFTVGIALSGCVGMQAEGNETAGFVAGVYGLGGIASRFDGNTISDGGVGVAAVLETGALITDNRIGVMASWGLAGAVLIGHSDFARNRLAYCGLAGVGAASIMVIYAPGIVRIAGNEVLDTGVSPTGTATKPVYGIAGMLILQAIIEGNTVGFTSPSTRDTAAEDRAAILMGLIELEYATTAITLVEGFPVQILGNSFVGTGASALVELLQNQVAPTLRQRFERVTFSNNYCEHFLATDPPAGAATVKLTGYAASVTGNHIKSLPKFPSIDFGGMPGACVANVISGPIANHAAAPAPDGNLNVTL